ncbi:ommochrome-binding protein-like [Leguminivora glycinivorella]|uniref:ommochrome-binding protein-like n=1 Tax=Leguminivora glycinivorella TaxID=1035111 RepID=UPI00200EF9D9|nr:ommochrome-binding protein-like [Leguminivora glycinivorella]
MKLFLLFALVAIVTAEEHKSKCKTISVRGKIHKKEVLATGINRPYQLSMYKNEHKIFFSYNVGKNEEDTFEIGYIKKGENNVTSIKGVLNGFASAVDEENHHVYLGGSKGIYKYHPKDNDRLEKIVSGHNIWYMFFHKHLYFIDYPSQKLYVYKKKNETEPGQIHEHHIKDKIYQYVIDKHGDQFMTTDSGLYGIKEGSSERHLYSDIKLFRGAALDNTGNAYFCSNHSIYATNKTNHSLEEIVHVRNVFGITFDSQDNFVYSDPKSIVKLLPGKCD